MFSAAKVAAEVRGYTLRGCMGYSRLERAGEPVALCGGMWGIVVSEGVRETSRTLRGCVGCDCFGEWGEQVALCGGVWGGVI